MNGASTVLAIVANEQTPYRLHLHRRIARELRDVELWSLFTHEQASSPWLCERDPAIRPVLFGRGDATTSRVSLRSLWRDGRKGGVITQWLEEHAVDTVVLGGYNDLARLRILLWCRNRDIPCMLFADSNIRGDLARGLKRLLKSLYLRWVLRQVSAVLHCGRLGREYFLRYGARPDQLFPFPYEPDYTLFANPDEQIVCRLMDTYQLDPGRRRFIFVGRLINAKRPDLLVAAFSAISGQRPNWDLLIVGDGEKRGHLERSAANTGIAGRIRFTGFLTHPAELAALYRLSDVFVLPSDYEPWGVVVTEAASAGLALVASCSVGAAADVIVEGRNGWLFNPGDSNDLQRALLASSDEATLGQAKAASQPVLSGWREVSDPVVHLQTAIHHSMLRKL